MKKTFLMLGFAAAFNFCAAEANAAADTLLSDLNAKNVSAMQQRRSLNEKLFRTVQDKSASAEQVSALLKQGAQVNFLTSDTLGRTVLMAAVDSNASDSVIAVLINAKADVNAVTLPGENGLLGGKSVLEFAVKANRPEVVKMLVKAGAKDKDGKALDLALFLGYDKLVFLLKR